MSILDDKIARFGDDMDLLHQLIHGDASTSVATENGPLRSISKLQADVQAEVLAAGGQLAAISTLFHAGVVVKAFLYDTSKDSDGGQWRSRCAGKSWYQEKLYGTWRGRQVDEAAARAIVGATTNDYFQSTTDGKFYALNAGAGVTEVFRGDRAEMPEQVLIVAEVGRVVLYDATDVMLPMWMVFLRSEDTGNRMALGGSAISSVTAKDGKLFVTDSGVYLSLGLGVIDFVKDSDANYTSDAAWCFARTVPLNLRNSATANTGVPLPVIVNFAVTDVAVTVLPDAPHDPATGLPVPTIAAATAGGVSVVKHDGTIANWLTNVGTIHTVTIDARQQLYAGGGDSPNYHAWRKNTLPTASPDNTFDFVLGQSSVPPRPGTDANTGQTFVTAQMGLAERAIGSGIGGPVSLMLLHENSASYTNSLSALISNIYNTGWLCGDIQCAITADTVGTVSDRGAKTLSVAGTYLMQPVNTGAALKSFTGTTDVTATLPTDISATGELMWWEKTAGVWKFNVKNLAGGTDTVDGIAAAPSTNVYMVGTTLTILSGVEVANVRASATIASDDQIAKIYRDEFPMFQPQSQCLLDGATEVVTALAYDDDSQTLHVGTSWGRSAFRGFVRTESVATQVGVVTSIAAMLGSHITAGTNARFSQPAIELRDELRNKAIQRTASKIPVAFDSDISAGVTAVAVPRGFTVNDPRTSVVVDGAKKRRGIDYTVSFDGFAETINFAAAPGAVWVQQTALRI